MQSKSRSQLYLEGKDTRPEATVNMGNSVSAYRKEALGEEVSNGIYKSGAGAQLVGGGESNVLSSIGRIKNAQVTAGGYGGYQSSGAGNTALQTPEIYSPLWLNSNLNMPRDRATINAWCRAFFALNGFVHNAISLHSTYPISKLNIKCANKDVEKFFNDMIDEIDLMNVCVEIAQEYWLLGEAFPYAELDESKGKWSRIVLQNPDYIILNKTVVAGEPNIQLKPDEHLKKIIFSNKAKDVEQRKNLSQYVVDSIKKGGTIPLPSLNISHLARKISPYSVHGTGLPVCAFRQLMLFDQLRECYDEETEVLTLEGFKKIHDLVEVSTKLTPNPEYVNGIIKDQSGAVTGILKLKENINVACFNAETENIEYHVPTELHMSQYEGEMIHFKSRNVDVMVSPNHKMWVQNKKRVQNTNVWSEWSKTKASDMSLTKTYRFRGNSGWSGKVVNNIDVLNKSIPIDLYLKMIGYVISEGCLSQNCIDFCQKISSDCLDDMKTTLTDFAQYFDKSIYERIVVTKDFKKMGFKSQPDDRWNGRINSKSLMSYFIDEISVNGTDHTAEFKRIPLWIKELSKEHLSIILETLVLGDGSHLQNKQSEAYKYYTASEQLADDVQEIAFKCGYSPTKYSRQRSGQLREFTVSWSNAQDGNFPIITPNNKYPQKINKVDYSGVVWCFEVPTGLFITRRNGKISIHGNSKYVQATNMINPLTLVKVGGSGADGFKPTFQNLEEWRDVFANASADKDFKIFTHEGVTVEKIGSNSGVLDISPDITQLMKEIFIGLQVPSILMDGGADTTYANGGVALDVLQQRYMTFRNMMSSWLRTKIFAPISKIQEFYEFKDGKKQLIVPEVDWNHMSIFQTQDYIQQLVTLSGGEGENKRISVNTLYRSMGLEYEDEMRKIRREAVQNEIAKKEKEALSSMSLNDLRTLGDEDEIQEVESSQNGNNGGDRQGGGASGDLGDMGGPPGGGGGGGGDLGGMDMPDGDIPGLDLGGDMGDLGDMGGGEAPPPPAPEV